jgi:hypothetical protein
MNQHCLIAYPAVVRTALYRLQGTLASMPILLAFASQLGQRKPTTRYHGRQDHLDYALPD